MAELESFANLSEDDAKHHLLNLFPSMDNGLDARGQPDGSAGDGAISKGELAIRLVRVEQDRQVVCLSLCLPVYLSVCVSVSLCVSPSGSI